MRQRSKSQKDKRLKGGNSCRRVPAKTRIVLARLGKITEARRSALHAIDLRPGFIGAWNNLGLIEESANRYEAAVAAFSQAVVIQPRSSEAQVNLARLLRIVGRLEESTARYELAIQLEPHHPETWNGLSQSLMDQGRQLEAIQCLRRAVGLAPDVPTFHNNLLMAMHYVPEITREALFAEHLLWAERHVQTVPPPRPVRNDRDSVASRKLRIGYVSPHLREHPISRFLLPILQNHDRSTFEVSCYSDTDEKKIFPGLREVVDHWRSTGSLSDTELVQQIQRDRIDILIDLAGHMGPELGRLNVFAHRPAPVQFTYLGYPDTTGLRNVFDGRITDGWHDPEGETDRFHTEPLVRVPGGCWSFYAGDARSKPPTERPENIRFGSLNRMLKVTPHMLRLWAHILKATPGSTLLQLTQEEEGPFRRRLASHDIDPATIRIARPAPRERYLELFNSIDIHLDTFPQNGHTTTCDAASMGVPTISLAGDRHVSRAGMSIMSSLGLQELIATTSDEYCGVAIRLSKDDQRLTKLASILRESMGLSSPHHACQLTKHLEESFRVTAIRTLQLH